MFHDPSGYAPGQRNPTFMQVRTIASLDSYIYTIEQESSTGGRLLYLGFNDKVRPFSYGWNHDYTTYTANAPVNSLLNTYGFDKVDVTEAGGELVVYNLRGYMDTATQTVTVDFAGNTNIITITAPGAASWEVTIENYLKEPTNVVTYVTGRCGANQYSAVYAPDLGSALSIDYSGGITIDVIANDPTGLGFVHSLACKNYVHPAKV